MNEPDKKVILAFIDWYRPGYRSGGTVTSFGNYVDKMEGYFIFKIVTRDTDYLDQNVYDNIESDSWNKMGNHHCLYLSAKSRSFKKLRQIIQKTPHDYIYVNGVFSLYFSILPLLFLKGRPCILNPHGMLSTQAFSVRPLKKKLFLKIADCLRWYRNVAFHVSNEEEAVAVRNRIKNYKSITIASQFTRDVPQDLLKIRKNKAHVHFVNVARVAVEKGTLHLVTALKNVTLACQLDLYGPIYDTTYWSKCERAIAELPKHVSVSYKGIWHSTEVLQTLVKYDYFVLLSEGENFGHAIFEAFSVGLPVIISDATPWRNLQEKNIGWDLALNTSEVIGSTFESAILKSDRDYREMSRSAIAFAKSYAEDNNLISANLKVFEL